LITVITIREPQTDISVEEQVTTITVTDASIIGAKGEKGDKGDPGADSTVPGPAAPIAGNDTQVIFNDNGGYAGNDGLTYNKSNKRLSIKSLTIPSTNEDASEGVIFRAGDRFLHTYGNSNFFYGVNAGNLAATNTGSQNTAFGYECMVNIRDGSYNTGFGFRCMPSITTGNENSFVGRLAGENITTGESNAGFGNTTLQSITTGSNNTAQNKDAGRFAADGSTGITSATGMVMIGPFTRSKQNGTSGEIVIGSQVTGNGSNTTTIGQTTNTDNFRYGTVTYSGQAGTGVAFVMVDANGKQTRNISPVRPIRTITASATLASSDYTVLVNAATVAINATLPAAASHTGRIFNIKKIDASANIVTVVGTIEGVANRTLTTQWATICLQSTGTSWVII